MTAFKKQVYLQVEVERIVVQKEDTAEWNRERGKQLMKVHTWAIRTPHRKKGRLPGDDPKRDIREMNKKIVEQKDKRIFRRKGDVPCCRHH